MDAQRFIVEFGHIVNAPGGVAWLREMIYQLAITGSLTPRDDSADDAGILLADIEHARQNLIRAKKYKRMLELESETVRPPLGIVIPPSWRWTRLLDIGEINPRNDAPDERITAFLPMSGVPQLHRGAVAATTMRWEEIKKGYTHFANGDVVLAKITPCFENGKAAVIANLPGDSGIGAGTTELLVFRPIHAGLLAEYVYLFLHSPMFAVEGEKNMTGTAGQKRLPTEYFATRAFPLPPTEEQSRIVAKVDELMALCDQLEAQQQSRRQLQTALRRATLQALAAATSPAELHTAWTRLADNFGQLFSVPEDVDELRSLCVELAIRGELVSSDVAPTEDSARSSLADEPFPIPKSWRWIRFDDLLRNSESGWSPKCDAEPRKPGEWGVLKVSAVTWGEFRPQENKRLPPSLEPRPEAEVKPGDFLLSRANTAELVARSVVVPDDVPEKLLMSDKIIRLNFADPERKAWANLVNNSLYARDYYRRNATGTSASMRNVSRQVIHGLPIPLPPKPAQQATLEKLTRLQRWYNLLEQQLRDARKLAERVATAAVSSLTGIAIDSPQEEAMRAPKTELFAPLHLGKSPSVKEQAPLAAILAHTQGGLNAKDLWRRYGGEIDAFYAQLKTEVTNGWIREPEPAVMNEIHEDDRASA